MSRSSEWRDFVWGKFNIDTNLNLDVNTNLGFIRWELFRYSYCDFEYFFRKIF